MTAESSKPKTVKKMSDSNPTPGDRLLYLRKDVARLSRRKVAEKYNIPEVTLKSWERNQVALSDKAVKRCIDMFLQEKIVVTPEWLLCGEGVDPAFTLDVNRYLLSQQSAYPVAESKDSFNRYGINSLGESESSLLQDAQYFRQQYQDSLVHLVQNDEMLPLYGPGDYVGGRECKVGTDAFQQALEHICIVRLTDESLVLRHLALGDAFERYHLSCTNPRVKTKQPVWYNVEIVAAAKVIWHRCPE